MLTFGSLFAFVGVSLAGMLATISPTGVIGAWTEYDATGHFTHVTPAGWEPEKGGQG